MHPVNPSNPHLARKDPGYLVLPINTGPSAAWEGFVTTNPTCARVPGDPRVFLGYRASGAGEHYHLGGHGSVWGSLLGLAVLDPTGQQVLHRLPLPIMRQARDVALPQTEEEFHAYQKAHGEKVVVLHDFRFFVHGGHLHVIYHQGSLVEVEDCIRRMRVEDFLARVAESIALSARPVDEIRARWEALWWNDAAWAPCGVDGSPRLFASKVQKGDNVFLPLADGTLQLSHRPCPDNAIVNTGHDAHARATPDGLTTYGTLESCARPGRFDNSHIGPNGNPVPARVGRAEVYIDIIHGVHNEMLGDESINTWKLLYLPYLRVKDAATGDLLHYSEEPVLLADETWREQVEHGPWVSRIPHLDGVIFTGGQVPVDPAKTGLDDEFITYCGVGDSAVAKARFTLRELLPPAVASDIDARGEHLAFAAPSPPPAGSFDFPEALCGWTWRIATNASKRCIGVHRVLATAAGPERAERLILPRPGQFDADGLWLDGRSVQLLPGLGWAMLYHGARWTIDAAGAKATTHASGLLLLHPENPEKVLFRSVEPLPGSTTSHAGWCFPAADAPTPGTAALVEAHVPAVVLKEARRTLLLEQQGLGFPSQMTKWLKDKSARNKPAPHAKEATDA